MKFQITDIDWDDEGEAPELPTETTITLPPMAEDEITDALSDALSDRFGFTHNGFKYARDCE